MIYRIAPLAVALGLAFYAMGTEIDSDRGLEKNTQIIPIYIQKIKNMTASTISVESTSAAPEKTTRLSSKLLIPFVSLATYSREYACKKAYTPEEALTIATAAGRYRLWASESGVMCARDPHDDISSLDSAWDAEKILGNTKRELGAKKELLATLVFARIKNNEPTICLEPAHS